HPCHDGIADLYRCFELQRLRQVNAPGTREARSEYGRNQSCGQHAVSDPAAEHRACGEFLVQVNRVGVAGDPCEHQDVGFGNSAGDGRAHVQFVILESMTVYLAKIALCAAHEFSLLEVEGKADAVLRRYRPRMLNSTSV